MEMSAAVCYCDGARRGIVIVLGFDSFEVGYEVDCAERSCFRFLWTIQIMTVKICMLIVILYAQLRSFT